MQAWQLFALHYVLNGAFDVDIPQSELAQAHVQIQVIELPQQPCVVENSANTSRWVPTCARGLTKYMDCRHFGFQYSMEWNFAQVLSHPPFQPRSSFTSTLMRFVYFPHCVSQVYFALKGKYNLSHWQAIEVAETEYLIPLLRWVHASPLHKKHRGRNFWTVFGMDLGRQDFPRSARWLKSWSVGSLTGSESWLFHHGAFWKHGFSTRIRLHGAAPIDSDDCWQEDAQPVVAGSPLVPPRNFRPQDTVVIIQSRFTPRSDSRKFHGRSVLAFFAGSPNSCARRQILERFKGKVGFDVSPDVHNDSMYQRKMLRSRFCLILCGSSHTNNVRLYDVIAHGCIPVIISDDFQPPLSKWVPWKEIGIFLPTEDIPYLGRILRNITELQRWRYFQNLVLGTSLKEVNVSAAHGSAATDRTDPWSGRKSRLSGLSAATVFDLNRVEFWLLFLHEVMLKLGRRMAKQV